jgi:hypothetical protein
MAQGVSIVHTDQRAFSLNIERNFVVSHRNEAILFVADFHDDVGDVTTISDKLRAVRQ